MATYCIPTLSSLPGSPASDFDWWSAGPDPSLFRYYPDNPNWLGAFSLSEGNGANREKLFRVLRGTLGGQDYLLLQWVVRTSMIDLAVDRANVLIGTGGNYIAFSARVNTTSSTVAGTNNAMPTAIFTYRVHRCTVAGGVITATNPPVIDGADIETTGRMWVDVTSPTRNIGTKWAFQVAIPLGAAWGYPMVGMTPAYSITLPAAGAIKMWFEMWGSVGGMGIPQQWPTTAPQTANVLQTIPTGITEAQLMDFSTAGVGCTDETRLEWGNLGTRAVPGGMARPDQNTIKLDLGKAYPPNNKPYTIGIAPDVTNVEHQNQFFATPTFAAGLNATQKETVRAAFSLANWGSQYSDPSAASWRPIPGGEDVPYLDVNGECRFIWPGVAEPTGPGSFLRTLVDNIKLFLNNDPGPKPAGAQNPHQCMLVELSSTDPAIVITQSSVYANMNIANASTFRRAAEISVVGAAPISATPRDVYLYVQKFNMPAVAPPRDGDNPVPGVSSFGNDNFTFSKQRQTEVEELAAFVPTYTVHAYIDTGKKLELEDHSKVAILRPQTAFGYFMLHEGDLYGWETRLYGAEKLAENFYVIRVPNNGSAYVETAIQARETSSEQPLPDDKTAPKEKGGCLAMLLGIFKKKP